jgi:hypothetical protein
MRKPSRKCVEQFIRKADRGSVDHIRCRPPKDIMKGKINIEYTAASNQSCSSILAWNILTTAEGSSFSSRHSSWTSKKLQAEDLKSYICKASAPCSGGEICESRSRSIVQTRRTKTQVQQATSYKPFSSSTPQQVLKGAKGFSQAEWRNSNRPPYLCSRLPSRPCQYRSQGHKISGDTQMGDCMNCNELSEYLAGFHIAHFEKFGKGDKLNLPIRETLKNNVINTKCRR